MGHVARMVADGIRGVTGDPTIFTKAIVGSAGYDEQFSALTAAGLPIEDAAVARDTAATLLAARSLHERIGELTLFVRIPATAEGVPAVRALDLRVRAAIAQAKLANRAFRGQFSGERWHRLAVNTLPEVTIAARL